jgi:hypothetical protein
MFYHIYAGTDNLKYVPRCKFSRQKNKPYLNLHTKLTNVDNLVIYFQRFWMVLSQSKT